MRAHVLRCTGETRPMSVEIRVATDDDWPAMERLDGRIFGAVASEQAQAGLHAVADTSRFRLATTVARSSASPVRSRST